MRGAEFAELKAFSAAAELLSFSRGAEQLGISASALSQTIRTLENRLGVRLLNRTTRTVALTEAGSRLYARVVPLFASFEEAISEINEARDAPTGTLRLCAPQMAILHILQPMLAGFQQRYPDVVLDITSDDSVEDIVGRGFDAGIRLGTLIEKDMIAVRISEPLRQIAVASPEYLESQGSPAAPTDLLHHRCINWRRPGRMGVYSWKFARGNEKLDMVVTGTLIVNDCAVALQSAVDGLGITVWIEDWMTDQLSSGRLVPLLQDWAPPASSFYLYHPSHVHVPAPLRAFITALTQPGCGLTCE